MAMSATSRRLFEGAYKTVFKPIAFLHDAETMHERISRFGQVLGRSGITRWLTRALFSYQNPLLEQTLHGIQFRNPIGLAAGFDKDGVLLNILPSVGFGFVEVGSVTALPCAGNPKPRLWRLQKSKALVVHYGLNSIGSQAVAKRLRGKAFKVPVGISIALTNDPSIKTEKQAIEDYRLSLQRLKQIGAYVTVNISCPNTQIGQPFRVRQSLDRLLGALRKVAPNIVMFVKLSPDIALDCATELVRTAQRHGINGIICSNLTDQPEPKKIKDGPLPGPGGVSGKVVEAKTNALIGHVYRLVGGKTTVIGCGGVFSAQDAYKKIKLGASLVQLITGMIFVGPQLIGDINAGLVELLRRDGFESIEQAVGSAYSKTK